jgi:hypothetical protein
MMPFLARLVERSAPAPQGSTVPLPVVPPLFAAGTMLEPGAPPEIEGQRDMTSERAAPPSAAVTVDTLTSPRSAEALTAASPSSVARTPPAIDRELEPLSAPSTPARLAEALGQSAVPRSLEPRVSLGTDPDTRAGPTRAVARASPLAPAPRPAAPHQSQAADAAPIVRVTIGRIEVRAVTSPAPAVPRSPAAPARRAGIALEDYLRSGSARP